MIILSLWLNLFQAYQWAHIQMRINLKTIEPNACKYLYENASEIWTVVSGMRELCIII